MRAPKWAEASNKLQFIIFDMALSWHLLLNYTCNYWTYYDRLYSRPALAIYRALCLLCFDQEGSRSYPFAFINIRPADGIMGD